MTNKEENKEEPVPEIINASKKDITLTTNWLSIGLRLIPAIGIIAALLYFLGRLRTESYYNFIGLNPYILNFTPEDYMFSSFNLALMLIVIIIVTLLMRIIYEPTYEISFKTELFEKLETLEEKMRYFNTYINRLQILSGVGIYIETASSYLFPLLFGILLSWSLITSPQSTEWYRGMLGLALGAGLGMIFGTIILGYTLYMRYQEAIEQLSLIDPELIPESLQAQWKEMRIKTSRIPRRIRFWIYITIPILVLIATAPFIADAVGKSEANYDVNNIFPVAIIYSINELPTDLQNESSEPAISKQVKLVTTNNGMTYALHQDSDSAKEWQIYAIPEESISQIIYLHKR